MSNLNEIKTRHGSDGWKDAIFIAVAVLLTAISVASVTARVGGHPSARQWSLTMVETPDLAK